MRHFVLFLLSISIFSISNIDAQECTAKLSELARLRTPTNVYTIRTPNSSLSLTRTFLIFSDHQVLAIDSNQWVDVLNRESAQTPRNNFKLKANGTHELVAINVSGTHKRRLIDQPFGFGLKVYHQHRYGIREIELPTDFSRPDETPPYYEFTDSLGVFEFSPKSQYLAVAVRHRIIVPGGNYSAGLGIQIFDWKNGFNSPPSFQLITLKERELDPVSDLRGVTFEHILNLRFSPDGRFIYFDVLNSEGRKLGFVLTGDRWQKIENVERESE